MTVLDMSRRLMGISLDELAQHCGCRRAWLSVVCRYPERYVSPRIRRKLSEFFNGADYDTVLSKPIDNIALARSILSTLSKKEETL